MPGRERRSGAKLGQHSNPLGEDLNAERFALAKKNKTPSNDSEAQLDDLEHNTAGFLLSARTTKKIFQRAREQLSQVQEEQDEERMRMGGNETGAAVAGRASSSHADGEGEEEEVSPTTIAHTPKKKTVSFHTPGEENHHEEEENGGVDKGLAALLRSQYAAPSPFYAPQDTPDDEDAVVLEYDDDNDDTASVMSELPAEEGGLMRLAATANERRGGGGEGTTEEEESSGGAGKHIGAMEAYYGIDEEEARLLERFAPSSRAQSRHLSGIIMDKIREKAVEEHSQHASSQEKKERGRDRSRLTSSSASLRGMADEEMDEEDDEDGAARTIDPRVARVYTAIGTLLKRYTSGKVPKAFKILPNVENWEALLLLTKPEQWSPHAVYQATRIFSANLNEQMAQRFYASVLLPIVHQRMVEEKKLHPALYMAVRKALFKPIAFFKGFLLPLATDEECTLREALIIASILQRSHLPPVPTAVALVKIAQQPFRGPCTVFLRVLIDKQMALPYQAIDAMVIYFHRFIRTHSHEASGAGEGGGNTTHSSSTGGSGSSSRLHPHLPTTAMHEVKGRMVEVLPVLWHQTLLLFVQRYKHDLTMAQTQLLMQVCSIHFHYMITPEIKRELVAAQKHLQQPSPTGNVAVA